MTREQIIEILENYKLRIPPTVYYELLADVQEAEEAQEPTTKNDLGVDCVSRKEVFETIDDCNSDGLKGIFCSYDDGERFKDYIKNLPSVTPQPKKGHWIVQPSNKEQGERDFIWWKCSECGQVIFSETEKDRKEFHAFCGRCGADMNCKEKK